MSHFMLAEGELLRTDCADNLPFCEELTAASLERIRYAVLKISGGSVSKLVDAVLLAQEDWRDALVAAGFGDDSSAHETWWPNNNAS